MLKSIYEKLEDIPEGDRAHYAQADGKYVLQLDNEHPVIVKNGELLRQHSTDKGAITRLTNEKATLEATALPAGHVAMPSAKAQLLPAYEALGKPEDLKAAVGERDGLKAEVSGFKKDATLREVAEAYGWPFEAFKGLDELHRARNLQYELKEVEEDGQKVKRATVKWKDGDKEETKPLKEYAETEWKPFMPSLKQEAQEQQGKGGTTFIRQSASAGGGGRKDAAKDYVAKTYAQPEKK